MPGFGPAAEVLLVRQKDPKPLTPRPATFNGTDAGWRADQLATLRQGPPPRDESARPLGRTAGVGHTGEMERYESFEVGGCFNPFLLFFFYEVFFQLGEVFDSEGWECIGPVFHSLV